MMKETGNFGLYCVWRFWKLLCKVTKCDAGPRKVFWIDCRL